MKISHIREVNIIPSKSDAHRALIAAFLCPEPCEVEIGETSVDIEATKACLGAMGNALKGSRTCHLFCHESGTTFRLLIPLMGALGLKGVFHPEGRLGKRPLSPLYEELEKHGMKLSPQGEISFTASGNLMAGEYILPGNVSSQYISGLLIALPLLNGDSKIKVTGNLESKPYVDMTLKTLENFGIDINITDAQEKGYMEYNIKGNQSYKSPGVYTVEGDWSNAAFWLAMGIIGDIPVKVNGLNMNSLQGDKRIIDEIEAFGGNLEIEEGSVTAYPSRENLKAIKFDAKDTPDMVLAISLIATQAEGDTEIYNAERLRAKESDRLVAVSATLNALGAKVKELDKGLIISGKTELKGCRVDSFNDHRIAMMEASASVISDGPVIIADSKAVNKSYPEFYNILRELDLGSSLELK